MVLFCISLVLEEFEDYSHQVSTLQESAVKKYVNVLKSGKGNTSQALHKLLSALFTQDRGNSSRHTLTVYKFLMLYSFRQEGHLAKADVITQYISALVFLGRATIFREIETSMSQTKKGFFA